MKTSTFIGFQIVTVLVTAVALHGSVPPEPTVRDILRQRLGQWNHDACIVAGVIDPDGKVVVGEGPTGAPHNRPANGNTVFEIGSVTKVFTGTLLADMVKRGQVRLNDPASKYLPIWAGVPTRKGRQITLVDLATHTSGLPRMPDNFAPADPANPYADYTPGRLYAFLWGYRLPHDIGSQFEYSNLGVGLLGHVLARASGESYETLVLHRICAPLGMNDTRLTFSPDMKPRVAPGHDAGGEPIRNWDFGVLEGAGGIRSTANDMLKFVAANAGLTKSDLWPAMQLAHQPRHEAHASNVQVGLCWHITTESGKDLVWHNGQTGGYHSFIGFDPNTKLGVVVLTNIALPIDDIGFHLLDPHLPLTSTQPAAGRVAIQLQPEVLDKYVGRYEVMPGSFFNIRRHANQLQAQLTGQPYVNIFPQSETEFFYKVVDAQLTFRKDEHGKVNALVLHQNGMDMQARKISDVPPPERKVVKLDPKVYDRYIGQYELAPGAVFTVKRQKDRLLVGLTSQPFFEVLPESEREFFYEVVDAQLTFVATGDEPATALILHQNGRNLQARRIK